MPEPIAKLNTEDAGLGRSSRSALRSWRGKLLRVVWLWREKGAGYILSRAWLRLGRARRGYSDWIEKNDSLSAQDLAQICERLSRLRHRPLISLVLMIDAADAVDFRPTIDSVRAQIYDKWRLHIVVHGSDAAFLNSLESHVRVDERIDMMPGMAKGKADSGNAAIARTTGEFVGFLTLDDRLAPHALYLVAEEIEAFPDVNLIYTDEDKIDSDGRRFSPEFKTDWNPDLLLSQNYIGQLSIYRRELIARLGFRGEFEGIRAYDLMLRAVESIAQNSIRHIPYVLVHCATHAIGADDDDASQALRIMQDHVDRTGIHAIVETSRSGRHLRVRRMLPAAPPRVSVIIPTRDRADLLRGAVESILDKTSYPDFEIVVVDNQTIEPAALTYLASLANRPNVRVLKFGEAFNHSAINNFAAKQCQSPILAFLNNDVLVIAGDWLGEMVSQAIRREVGAVGAMLYYPDDVIQHAGVILGSGGVASNCYSGLHRGSSGYFARAELLQNYSAVTAACLVTRADVFEEAGGFNEMDLPIAFNDVDYCLRLRESGLLITWTPYAELYHLESVSRGDDMSPGKVARFRRDQAYMTRRWSHVLTADPFYNLNLSLDRPFALADLPRIRRPWKAHVEA